MKKHCFIVVVSFLKGKEGGMFSKQVHGKINNVKVSYDFEQPSWHDIYVYQDNESIGTFKTCGSVKPRKIIEIIHGMLDLFIYLK
jgi:hypothetical protein